MLSGPCEAPCFLTITPCRRSFEKNHSAAEMLIDGSAGMGNDSVVTHDW